MEHDPYAALRFRNYRFFAIGRLIHNVGMQMQSVAVGWQLYERTGSAMALGMVGLVQVIPVLLLPLIAGHVADRFNRKYIILVTQIILSFCSICLVWLSLTQGSITWIYITLLGAGIARAFNNPAASSLLPQIIPMTVFPNAVAWSSSGFEVASFLGPALAGFVIALNKSATLVYGIDAVAALISFGFIFNISNQQTITASEPVTFKSLAAGMTFVWNSKNILAALTLDLFAVLLGGAIFLLPIFAKDILQVGPVGLGWLRAAPSMGALLTAITVAHNPPFKKAGKALLWAVSGFGMATIIFGFSHWFWLSILMLFFTGVFDNISVVIRHTLVQVLTPDHMRGRVSAVNAVFYGSSNEFGGFESGLVAYLFGPVVSVVGGGIGTLIVVAGVIWIWPQIACLSSLHQKIPVSTESP